VHHGEHLVAVNLSSEPRTVHPGTGDLRAVLTWDPRDAVMNGGEINLGAESAAVLERVPFAAGQT
jgi:hypothetical protein